MALSGTINGSVTLNVTAYNYYIDWTATQSIAGNYSDVVMKVYWSRNAGFFNEFDTVGTRNASVTIGDSTFSWSQRFDLQPFSQNPYLIKEYSARVNHNADGTKSVLIAARANGYAATFGPSNSALSSGDCVASATVVLDTIPRASTTSLNKASLTAGDNLTVTITPATHGVFSHAVTWKLGSFSSTANLLVGTNSHQFTVPTAWCAAFPAANSGTASCSVQTKQGSTNIGAPVVKTFTVNVPSYSPTVGLTLTGNHLLSGDYVQDKSSVSGSVSSGSSYGATISSISTALSGKTYTGAAWTSAALTATGTLTATTTVTDSRGKTNTDSKQIIVYAYAAPYITTLTAVRCLSNGTPDDNGTYARVTFVGGCSAVNNKNARVYKVNDGEIVNEAYTINRDNIIVSGITTDATHTITASVQDSYTTVSMSVTVPTVEVAMDFHSSGKGAAFGKVSEAAELLDIAWPVKLHDTPAATGNLIALTGAGVIGDSGKKAADFEDSGAVSTHNTDLSAHDNRIPYQYTYYKGSAGSAWWKCFSFPWTDNMKVRATFISGAGYHANRGHAEIIISATSNNRVDLIYGTNGITTASFDVRQNGSMGSGTITVYFNIPQYTYYTAIVNRISWSITNHNTAENPSGTVIPIYETLPSLVPIANGGTGATTIAGARTNLGAEEAGKAVQKSGDVMTGPLEIRGTAASKPLKLRGITGDDGTGTDSDLYLQYGVNKKIMLGNNGGYEIAADGSTYSGKAANVSGTVAVANGGTGATTAANARTALGIRTFSGSCTIVTSGTNYGVISLSGVTTSSIVSATVRTSQPGTATGWGVYSAVPAANQVTIYFNHNSSTANINISVSVIAIG